MNKIEELINSALVPFGYKTVYIGEPHEVSAIQFLYKKTIDKLKNDFQSLINSAVEEANIKIAILEQEVDSWKNVFSKELVEEQKKKDAEIVKSKKYKEVETFYQNGINSVIEKIAKEILEQ